MSTELHRIETLYHQYGSEVLQYLTRRCPGHVAQDLLHDIFLRIVRHPARLQAAVTPRAWLFAITRHVLADHFRAQKNPDQLALYVEPESSGSGEDPRLATMRSALRELPAELQETLELRLQAELSYEEIAQVLGIPIGTVRSRLHHAVRRLRTLMMPPSSPHLSTNRHNTL